MMDFNSDPNIPIMYDIFLACIIISLAYFHIQHHLKTNNDLKVYDIRKPDAAIFEEVCDIKQPIKMDFSDQVELFSLSDLTKDLPLYIRNVQKEPAYVSMDNETADKVLTKDKKGRYISERNLGQRQLSNDQMLRPPLCAFSQYDYMRGSDDAETPFRYEQFHRHFLFVTEGSVTIHLATPDTAQTINITNDKTLSEVRTTDAFKTEQVRLSKGDLLYIPAYWWYRIKYTSAARLYAFKYHTYTSVLSIAPTLLSDFSDNNIPII